jgi:hypothetical protein
MKRSLILAALDQGKSLKSLVKSAVTASIWQRSYRGFSPPLKHRYGYLLAAMLLVAITGCTSAPTHWVDMTGQSRPDWQLEQTAATCQQQVFAAQQQEQAEAQQLNNGMGDPRMVALAAIGTVISVGEAETQYKLCMTQAGWEQHTVQSASSKSPQSSISGAPAMSGGLITTQYISIPHNEWRETSQGTNPATLFFINDQIIRQPDGVIMANIIANWDAPEQLSTTENAQSVTYEVSFHCNSHKAMQQLVKYYAGKDATGDLLKQVRNSPLQMEPNGVADQMRRYACFFAGSP